MLNTQRGMLMSEKFIAGTELHLLSSAELTGALDVDALRAALRLLTARHEGLRTVFVRKDHDTWRRVLESWEPALTEQTIHVAADDSPVAVVHEQLQRTSRAYLEPRIRPAVAFVLSRFGDGHHLLSMLVHHALIDGWSLGLFWREFVEAYGAIRTGAEPSTTTAPTIELVLQHRAQLVESGVIAELSQRRAEQLADLPTVLEVPTDRPRPPKFDFQGARLHFGLSEAARSACEQLAGRARITKTAALFAAWAVVIGRRCGMSRFIMGNSVALRTSAEIMRIFGPCASLAPVRCELPDEQPVREYLLSCLQALAEGARYGEVPFGNLIQALAPQAPEDLRRSPLVQVWFSAHDQFVPDRLRTDELDVVLREGHNGGTAADLMLFVQRWGARPRLALEYATSVYSPVDAADLAEALDATLVDLLEHWEAPLSAVRGMSGAQRQRLADLRDGPVAEFPCGLWQLIESRAEQRCDLVAVEDPTSGVALRYGELIAAAERQSAALAAAGVRSGDHVVIALPRSAAEIVAVLGTVRLGAAYVALHPASPPERMARMLDRLHPRAVIGTPTTAAPVLAAAAAPCAVVAPAPTHVDPGAVPVPTPPAAPADPDRIAYLLFTSGSTGEPKAVRVPSRGVLRLVQERTWARMGPGDRFMRFGTLAFDVSTFEIFAPLADGATVVVAPPGPPAPAAIAQFFDEYRITTAFLIAGLFRVVVDHRPDAFAGLRWVLSGGDVVPADQVRALLERYPRLAICNGYGPTENSVFTTAHTVADPCEVGESLPVGRPVAGTGVLILDSAGNLVPPGGIGELCTLGAGLGVDYYRNPEQTAAAFETLASGERVYHTGDLARWDRTGVLRFLGRVDNQVKIRGFRVELDEIRARLLEHPEVRDALVTAVGADPAARQILAGVVLAGNSSSTDLAAFAAETLPGYAVPSMWALVDTMPITGTGKPDVAALHGLALAPRSSVRAEPQEPEPAVR
jgi:amino acid adenylation domain-containing protein